MAHNQEIKVGDVATFDEGDAIGIVSKALNGRVSIRHEAGETSMSADRAMRVTGEAEKRFLQDRAVVALAASVAQRAMEGVVADWFCTRRGLLNASPKLADALSTLERLGTKEAAILGALSGTTRHDMLNSAIALLTAMRDGGDF